MEHCFIGCYEPTWRDPSCCFFIPVEMGLRILAGLHFIRTWSCLVLILQYNFSKLGPIFFFTLGIHFIITLIISYIFFMWLRRPNDYKRRKELKLGYFLSVISIPYARYCSFLLVYNYLDLKYKFSGNKDNVGVFKLVSEEFIWGFIEFIITMYFFVAAGRFGERPLGMKPSKYDEKPPLGIF